jgi:hypothetical protein
MPVVGFVGSESPDRWATYIRAFQQGLREVGYVEGHNVAIDYRWASSRLEHIVPGWSNPPPQHSETTQYEAKKRPEARSKANTEIPREQKTPEPGAQSALEE